jgi:very-short-patch-repair endonuclease
VEVWGLGVPPENNLRINQFLERQSYTYMYMKSEKWYAAMAARRGKGTNQYTKARENNLPKPTVSAETRKKISISSLKRKHTPESRLKISNARIKFLQENPDKVPYLLNHSSNGPSYAEQYWKTVLDNAGICYQEQYRVGLYSLDFVILDKKINIEIDGDQHYLDKRIVESDKRRTAFLEKKGWTVVRVRWSTFCKLKDKETFIKQFLNFTDQ